MFKILVTTDFSEESKAAFTRAAEQARLRPAAELTVLAVIEDVAPTSVQFEFALALVDTNGILEEARKAAQERIVAIAAEQFPDISVKTEVVKASRPVASEISHYAKQHGIDLIVMASHGRSGIKKLILGSVSEGVLHETPCPVLIVPTAV